MILQRLYEYSFVLEDKLKDNFTPPLYTSCYHPRMLTKRIHLTLDGKLAYPDQPFIALSGDGKQKLNKKTGESKPVGKDGKIYNVPQEAPRRGNNTSPRLICDNPAYVLGRSFPDKKANSEHHKAYCELLQECYEKTGNKYVKAILDWLSSDSFSVVADHPDIVIMDDFDFMVEDVRPVELPDVISFWQEVSYKNNTDRKGLCVITGKVTDLARKLPYHVTGKGVPGGGGMGLSFLSVNSDTDTAYNMSSSKLSLQSPISVYAAERICITLNQLISDERTYTTVSSAAKPVTYLHWVMGSTEVDPFTMIMQPSSAEVGKLLESYKVGKLYDLEDTSIFCVLGLSENSARAVIHGYNEIAVNRVKESLVRWFAALDLQTFDPTLDRYDYMGVFRLASSLFFSLDQMHKGVPVDLVNSALFGRPLPFYLLGLALERIRANQGPFYADSQREKHISLSLLALIKATTLKGDPELEQQCKEDKAFLCGRLLAELEYIQGKSSNFSVKATLTDKYYAAASAYPALTFGRLLSAAQSHISKLRKGSGDYFVQTALGEILEKIGTEFPTTLSLQQQGIFALGYYHQKMEHMRKKSTASETTEETSDEEKGTVEDE